MQVAPGSEGEEIDFVHFLYRSTLNYSSSGGTLAKHLPLDFASHFQISLVERKTAVFSGFIVSIEPVVPVSITSIFSIKFQVHRCYRFALPSFLVNLKC